MSLITVGVIAVVFAHWGLTAKDALDRGIFNFDSLWYHMPYAVDFAKGHSVTGYTYTETVLTNWFYPQNSELLHGIGILLTERDTLSLFLNFGWLAVAFLSAWCIGRPYDRGPLCVAAAAIVLECHTLVVREPGAAKNDLVAAALILAAIAILLNAATANGARGRTVVLGWPLAAAGLAVGLAVGTKVTALAMAAALTVVVIALAPAGRRRAAAAWWFVSALAAGGYWYLRNLIATGNPLPQVEHLGPIGLPHPERLQSGRPDHSILHYATDTGIWRDYFGPGLDNAFGTLWPIVVVGARGRRRRGPSLGQGEGPARGRGGGAVRDGRLPRHPARRRRRRGRTGRLRDQHPLRPAGAARGHGAAAAGSGPRGPPAPVGRARRPAGGARGHRPGRRGPPRPLAPVRAAGGGARGPDPRRPDLRPGRAARRRGRPSLAAFAGLALLVAAIGYPVQRHYLGDRFEAGSGIPGMDLDPAYAWARDTTDARIGLVGSSAGFLGYGFYGTDLSNDVQYLGVRGPHGAFNAIPTCSEFRAAVNDADLDYLVTAPFLNYINPDSPVPSPEAGWLRGEPAVEAGRRQRRGDRLAGRTGRSTRSGCGPENAPLRRIPQQPSS